VGIVYVAQNQDSHHGYHLNLMWWSTDEFIGHKIANESDLVGFANLRNFVGVSGEGTPENPDPSTYWRDAGMASIDIAPYNNDNHRGAIVMTQIVGADLFGPVAEIWQINSIADDGYDWVSLSQQFDDTEDGLWPSIAINHSEVLDISFASITYYGQIDPNSNRYAPTVLHVNLNDNDVIRTSNANGLIIGDFNISQFPFTHCGAASSIAVAGTDKYWAAWTSGWELESQPFVVQAQWGNAIAD